MNYDTLRIPTAIIKNEEGEPEIKLFHPSIRMGRGDSFVDNFSAGGVSDSLTQRQESFILMERTKKDTRMSVIRTVVSELRDSRFRSGMRQSLWSKKQL